MWVKVYRNSIGWQWNDIDTISLWSCVSYHWIIQCSHKQVHSPTAKPTNSDGDDRFELNRCELKWKLYDSDIDLSIHYLSFYSLFLMITGCRNVFTISYDTIHPSIHHYSSIHYSSIHPSSNQSRFITVFYK